MLEELGPVDRVEQPQAGDAVADRHLVGGLPPVFAAEHLGQVAGASGQPVAGGGRSGSSPPRSRRAWCQADQERVGRPIGQRRRDGGSGRPAHPRGGPLPVRPGGEHLAGQPPQVLQQRQPEHGRHRPQLAGRQRRDLLVRPDEPQDEAVVEVAVGVRDERDGQGVDARQAGPRPARHDREFVVVPAGQVGADLAEHLLDDVEVVEQPLGVRRERLAAGGIGRRLVARLPQHLLRVANPVQERPGSRPDRAGPVAGDGPGEIVEVVAAEQLAAKRAVLVPQQGVVQGGG